MGHGKAMSLLRIATGKTLVSRTYQYRLSEMPETFKMPDQIPILFGRLCESKAGIQNPVLYSQFLSFG